MSRLGYDVFTANDGKDAVSVVASQPVDLVITDVNMPGMDGIELVRQIHDLVPDLPCIVVTGQSTQKKSIEALRAGAYWFLDKSADQDQHEAIRRLVDQAINHRRLKNENRNLKKQLGSRHKLDRIIGKSAALHKVLTLVEKVAHANSTVLITGENGTGKELIAEAIH